MDLSEQIRRARKRLHWTQQQLAEYAGLSLTQVNRLENGHHDPEERTLQKLSTALGTTLRRPS